MTSNARRRRTALLGATALAVSAFGATTAMASNHVAAPICMLGTVAAPTTGGPWTAAVNTDGTLVDATQSRIVSDAAHKYGWASFLLELAADEYIQALDNADAAKIAVEARYTGLGLPALLTASKAAQDAYQASPAAGTYMALRWQAAPTYAVTPGADFAVSTGGVPATSWSMTMLVPTGSNSENTGGGFGPAVADPTVTAATEPGLYQLTVKDASAAVLVDVTVSVDASPWTTPDQWVATQPEYQALVEANAAADPALADWYTDQTLVVANSDAVNAWAAFVQSDGTVSPRANDQDYWLQQADPALFANFAAARSDYLDALGLDANKVLADADALWEAQPAAPSSFPITQAAGRSPSEWIAVYEDALVAAISNAKLPAGTLEGDTVAVELCGSETATVSFTNGQGGIVTANLDSVGASTQDGSVSTTATGAAMLSGYSSGLVQMTVSGSALVQFEFDAPAAQPTLRFETDLS